MKYQQFIDEAKAWITPNWLNLNKHFGPLSGFESRISDPVLRFVLTNKAKL